MLGTSALRREWAPACTGPFARIEMHGEGAISVRPEVAPAFLALNRAFIAWDYETRKADTGAYVCRQITGGSGYSLHALAIAADFNWQTNPYGPRLITDMPRAMVNAILAIRTMDGAQVFGWGGNYRTNKDAMHFEIVCTRESLATGIRASTVPGGPSTPPTPPPTPSGELSVSDVSDILTILRGLGSRLDEVENMAIEAKSYAKTAALYGHSADKQVKIQENARKWADEEKAALRAKRA